METKATIKTVTRIVRNVAKEINRCIDNGTYAPDPIVMRTFMTARREYENIDKTECGEFEKAILAEVGKAMDEIVNMCDTGIFVTRVPNVPKYNGETPKVRKMNGNDIVNAYLRFVDTINRHCKEGDYRPNAVKVACFEAAVVYAGILNSEIAALRDMGEDGLASKKEAFLAQIGRATAYLDKPLDGTAYEPFKTDDEDVEEDEDEDETM